MQRVQLQLTDEQAAALRRRAIDERKPVAAVVREAVDGLLARRTSEAAAVSTPRDADDVVGVAEVAARSGRSINTVQSWRRRDVGFPTPTATLAAGPIWNWDPVARWIASRSVGRLKREQESQASIDHRLPGADIVAKGLADLGAGRETVEGLLLQLAPERLADIGIKLPGSISGDPSGRLYEHLVDDVGVKAAHGRYNSLRRRLLSFLNSSPARGAATG